MKRLPCKAELARAIREGRKTETRRLINPQPDAIHDGEPYWFVGGYRAWETRGINNPLRMGSTNPLRPRYEVGDIVEITEPWALEWYMDPLSGINAIKASYPQSKVLYLAEEPGGEVRQGYGRTRLARFMPSAFVRTRVEIVGVDAISLENMPRQATWERRQDFAQLWDRLHPANPWSSNPFVWRYCFKLATA